MKKQEVIWLLGTGVIAFLLTLFIFGPDSFSLDATTDINIHDTYFVIGKIYFTLFFFVLVYFLVYLIRVLKQQYKNMTVNIVLIVVLIVFIPVLGKIISMMDFFSTSRMGEDLGQVSKALYSISWLFMGIQIMLLALLAYCGFKVGQLVKKKNSSRI